MNNKRRKELKAKRVEQRREAKAKKMRLLDEYDTKCYFKDLEYLGRLSYISESTRAWIESRMYELREKANVYEHKIGELLIANKIDFIHQAPFVFRPKTIYFTDFYLPKHRIVIEVDGTYHNSQTMLRKDGDRDFNFKSIGIRVIRVNNLETGDLKMLALRLSEHIKELRHE